MSSGLPPEMGQQLEALFYDDADKRLEKMDAYSRQREQFPVLRRNLRLNERAGLYRWLTILEIASLERTAPYLAAFGLPACDPGGLRGVARQTLQAIYPIEEDDTVDLSVFVEHLETALDRVEAQIGGECAAQLLEYGASRFPLASECRREDDWHTLLGRIVGASAQRYPLIQPSLPPHTIRRVRDAVLRHVDFDLNRRTEEDDKAPLTEWETVVYARCDGWSPLDVVWQVVLCFQVQAAWREIEAALSPHEVAELVAWGRRQAEVIPWIRPDRVDPPPTPIRLRED